MPHKSKTSKTLKHINNNLIAIIIFAFVFINNAKAQHDTIHLKEVTIPSGFTVDTALKEILFVLEKQPIKEEPCEYLDFIVLYDDFSGLSFEMGPIININQIYWAYNQDSIIFFSTKIYNEIKLIKKSDLIAKYLLNNGQRERIGNTAFGFDCLIKETSEYYWSYNKFYKKNCYLYKREEKLNNCKLEYYYRAIRKK